MIEIVINGKTHQFDSPKELAEFYEQIEAGKRVARKGSRRLKRKKSK